MQKRIFIMVGLGLLLVGVVIWMSIMREHTPSTDKIHVAATFYPLAFVAEQIGGERVDVRTITPTGIEPHDFEPTPRDIVAMLSANLVLVSGTRMDAWSNKVQSDLNTYHVPVVMVSKEVSLVSGPTVDGGVDPHFWLDTTYMATIGKAVQNALINIDPLHRTEYESRGVKFRETLQDIDSSYATGLAACVHRSVVVSHDAFRYLTQRYNLVSVPIAGISPEEEPSPNRIADIVQTVRATGANTVFFETLVSPALARTIADEAGIQVQVLNPIEGLTDNDVKKNNNYFSLMLDNLQVLRTALLCS